MPLDPRQAAGRTIRTYGQTSDHKWIVRLTAGGMSEGLWPLGSVLGGRDGRETTDSRLRRRLVVRAVSCGNLLPLEYPDHGWTAR
jgi:hypothetical protein